MSDVRSSRQILALRKSCSDRERPWVLPIARISRVRSGNARPTHAPADHHRRDVIVLDVLHDLSDLKCNTVMRFIENESMLDGCDEAIEHWRAHVASNQRRWITQRFNT